MATTCNMEEGCLDCEQFNPKRDAVKKESKKFLLKDQKDLQRIEHIFYGYGHTVSIRDAVLNCSMPAFPCILIVSVHTETGYDCTPRGHGEPSGNYSRTKYSFVAVRKGDFDDEAIHNF